MTKTRDSTTIDDKQPVQRPQRQFEGLRIGTKWGITSDGLNIILCRRNINKKTGLEYFVNEAYLGTLQGALKSLVNREVKETHLKDLKTICDKINQLYRDIDQLKREVKNEDSYK